ncbi:DUF4331 domain-containing protein [uncultured Jatrophihabitans sp.]|uniref:DUF4331 domain-containing protein n=1 Tax=uncultured Jatrophihabitans sp. TaxID=1610747 RepID=UPI0035CA6669
MSSHKEAPGIANDAAADNTDVYAFVSPDKPDTVTLIANFVPLEDPAGGPNFFEFGDDVLYEIHIDNDGDGVAELTYQFRFNTQIRNENTFLYNTGPIETIDSANWNRRQFYSVTKVIGAGGQPGGVPLGTNLACPPCNIGPASTPNYGKLASSAIHTLNTGETVFAGQRAEGFYVDLGAIFDLGILRPFLAAHLAKMPNAPGVNGTAAKNIHTIAIQVPKKELLAPTADGTTIGDADNIIGVYASASRQRETAYNATGTPAPTGNFVQVSRLANPLVNEVLINIPNKDRFNSQNPADDKQFATRFAKPELAGLLPVLYPGVFPHLAKFTGDRADIEAVFLTGLPKGVLKPLTPKNADAATKKAIADFSTEGDGKTLAELLRLNVAVPPTTKSPSNLGLLGLDLAGFPNGRRVFDDVTTIELRALAGAILPLVAPSYVPDAAAGAITQGLTSSNTDVTAGNTVHYLSTFPYLGTPHSGYSTPGNNDPAPDLGAINRPPSSSTIPVGAPQTGVAPKDTGSDTGVLAGAALAGLAVVGAAAARSRTVGSAASAAPGPAPQRPRPRPSRGDVDGSGA